MEVSEEEGDAVALNQIGKSAQVQRRFSFRFNPGNSVTVGGKGGGENWGGKKRLIKKYKGILRGLRKTQTNRGWECQG